MHFYVSSTAQENVWEWEQALWKWTKLKCVGMGTSALEMDEVEMWAELMGTSELKMRKAEMWAECEQTSWKWTTFKRRRN